MRVVWKMTWLIVWHGDHADELAAQISRTCTCVWYIIDVSKCLFWHICVYSYIGKCKCIFPDGDCYPLTTGWDWIGLDGSMVTSREAEEPELPIQLSHFPMTGCRSRDSSWDSGIDGKAPRRSEGQHVELLPGQMSISNVPNGLEEMKGRANAHVPANVSH